jgi:hypothetical protein
MSQATTLDDHCRDSRLTVSQGPQSQPLLNVGALDFSTTIPVIRIAARAQTQFSRKPLVDQPLRIRSDIQVLETSGLLFPLINAAVVMTSRTFRPGICSWLDEWHRKAASLRHRQEPGHIKGSSVMCSLAEEP